MNENKLSEQELLELYVVLGYSPTQKQTNIESINTQASDSVLCMIKERLSKIRKSEENIMNFLTHKFDNNSINAINANEQVIKIKRGQLSIILALPVNNS